MGVVGVMGDFVGDRECVTHCACDCIMARLERYEEALAYLADEESWGGDPHEHGTVLYGHDTPYELASAALGDK